jgi:hypothetical protein
MPVFDGEGENPKHVGGAPATERCSFCGKSRLHVQKMIAGTGVYICNECVELCVDILAADADGE